MKIFTSEQIRAIDKLTIENEPVSSIDLMERASMQLYKWIEERFGRSEHFVVFAGPGNNGGDGLALSRMLYKNGYSVETYYVKCSEKTSADWDINRLRLEKETKVHFSTLIDEDLFPIISSNDIIIDSIFGTGLTRPPEGLAAEVIRRINLTDTRKISVDIPSGLFGEDNLKCLSDSIIRADFTLSFQFPKLSYMFAENAQFLGKWQILPIDLDKTAIRKTPSSYLYLDMPDILPLIRKRNKFDHKGSYGHGLIIAGSSGKMGAAVLCASAALRSGMGLATCHIPSAGNLILQASVPEAMTESDRSESHFTDIKDVEKYNAIGVGPGLGLEPETQKALFKLMSEFRKPIVFDADALNILSMNKESLSGLPENSILTPHPKEFERLAGISGNGFERLQQQIGFSKKYRCIVVLKGANTSISTPEGKVFFNSTGNPGMATGGSGDVLTGILLSLLAQGYTSENAALTGVYLHGAAGDIAASENGYESMIASDIIKCLGKAFKMINEALILN
jgi:ADP-dependent NAD(P)H-hydrate dehydratase / NAD(P)H-hydrate epimerase